MAVSEIGFETRTVPLKAHLKTLLPTIVAIGFGALMLLFARKMLNDPDTYWHITVGNWILAHGFPTTDSFSSTFAGHHWIAKEWLSQLLYAGAFALGGYPAVGALALVATVAALALLFLFLSERLSPIIALALVAFAFLLIATHLLARPHVLAFPIMVLWIGLLTRAVDRGEVPSYRLLPLICLWANIHGGFTLGILLAGALGLDAIASAEKGQRKALFLGWLRFGVLTLAAACITPYGPESFLVTWRILSLGPALQMIREWRPPDFAQLSPVELVLLLGAGLALRTGFKLPPVRILVMIGLLHLTLSAIRNAELFGLLVPLILMKPLSQQTPAFCRAEPMGERAPANARLALALSLAAMLPVSFLVAQAKDWHPIDTITPTVALHAAQAHEDGIILNGYNFGGYMISVGAKTFIDGRTELYGGEFTARVQKAVLLTNLPDFFKLLDEYGVGATLLSPSTPAVALLDRTQGWRRIYADDIAVVHVRDGAAPAPSPQK